MTETTNTSFNIPEENLKAFEVAIEKLNRRAKRLGVPSILTEVESHKDVEIMEPQYAMRGGQKVLVGQLPTGQFRRIFTVKVIGERPTLNGYTFVATLEHVEGEVLLHTSRAFEGAIPVSFRTADPHNCDHCHTRRVRSETFVVQHEGGDFKQIGRQCLKDFLGYNKDPKELAAMAEILFEASDLGASAEEEGFGGGGGGVSRLSMATFLSFVAAAIRKEGWMSRSRAGQLEGVISTADRALTVMLAKSPHDAGWRRDGWFPTDDDRTTAEASLEWARTAFGGKDASERSDYEHNMAIVTKGETLTFKHAGLVASAVAGYQREQQKLLERKLEVVGVKDSKFIGTEGERLDFYGQLYKLIAIEGQYGTTWVHKFKTREGNMVVWFASSRPVVGTRENGTYIHAEPGDKEYLMTGTVKRHETREGINQTTMTRVVLWTDEGRAAHEEKLAKKAAREAKKAAKAVK